MRCAVFCDDVFLTTQHNKLPLTLLGEERLREFAVFNANIRSKDIIIVEGNVKFSSFYNNTLMVPFFRL